MNQSSNKSGWPGAQLITPCLTLLAIGILLSIIVRAIPNQGNSFTTAGIVIDTIDSVIGIRIYPPLRIKLESGEHVLISTRHYKNGTHLLIERTDARWFGSPQYRVIGRAPTPPPQKPVASQPETDNAATSEPLDLSPPYNISFEAELPVDQPGNRSGFDPAPLFEEDKEKTSRVSGTVTPIIVESEDPDKIAELDGGKVSVEVKTE